MKPNHLQGFHSRVAVLRGYKTEVAFAGVLHGVGPRKCSVAQARAVGTAARCVTSYQGIARMSATGGFVVPATVAEQVSAVAGGAAVARAGWGHNGGVAALREHRQSD